ncbi:MAG TPA: biopolymer transporter ExbD [Gemmatimonadaceae bacterium]|nr:biopolymer transporter ExbD [Gemmatimonadaceae bacterium]
MASLFHRSKQRRAERAPVTAHGNINLVPLVDTLTSIVFFSLLTYQGETMMALTSFDLSLPPVVVTTPQQASQVKSEKDVLNLLLAVRVSNDELDVEHSGNGGFRQAIKGLDAAALGTLQALMTQIRQQYPQNKDVLVIPSDDVAYDNIIHVLERLRLAGFTGISLGTRARGGPAAAGPAR